MDINKEWFGLRLRELAILSTGLYAGAAWYANAVEHPARMTSDMNTAIRIWRPSFNRAKQNMSKLALMCTLSSCGAYGLLKGTPKEDILWLVSGLTIGGIFPVTLALIQPINKELLETDKCVEKGPQWIKTNLNAWNFYHGFRTGLSLLSFGIMIYTISK